jgi:hypothetical protein
VVSTPAMGLLIWRIRALARPLALNHWNTPAGGAERQGGGQGQDGWSECGVPQAACRRAGACSICCYAVLYDHACRLCKLPPPPPCQRCKPFINTATPIHPSFLTIILMT